MTEPVSKPLSLLAEITYRCNLQCPYCYNPLDLRSYSGELALPTWLRVIDEAAALGVLQLHLSGGEPTLRPDELVSMVARARARDLYSNLITQGTFLTDALLDRLVAAGLDHVQLSLQGAQPKAADLIAGATVHEKKIEALRRVNTRQVALTINCVLHRANIDAVGDVIALAEAHGVRRLELANAQLYGWAFLNKASILPTREQVARADDVVAAAQMRLRGEVEITYVRADYYERFPKPCMQGWGRQFMTITPDGRTLPCPAAAAISTLRFPSVVDMPLAEIWYASEAFNAYRGEAWMAQPCRTCDRRSLDYGGCRCQAFLLTGDAGVTDPACSLSPHHAMIEALVTAPAAPVVPRRMGP